MYSEHEPLLFGIDIGVPDSHIESVNIHGLWRMSRALQGLSEMSPGPELKAATKDGNCCTRLSNVSVQAILLLPQMKPAEAGSIEYIDGSTTFGCRSVFLFEAESLRTA